MVLLRSAEKDAIWTLVGVVTEPKIGVMWNKELGGYIMAWDGVKGRGSCGEESDSQGQKSQLEVVACGSGCLRGSGCRIALRGEVDLRIEGRTPRPQYGDDVQSSPSLHLLNIPHHRFHTYPVVDSLF